MRKFGAFWYALLFITPTFQSLSAYAYSGFLSLCLHVDSLILVNACEYQLLICHCFDFGKLVCASEHLALVDTHIHVVFSIAHKPGIIRLVFLRLNVFHFPHWCNG